MVEMEKKASIKFLSNTKIESFQEAYFLLNVKHVSAVIFPVPRLTMTK